MKSFEDFLSEGKKIQIKRKYTENHPAATVGKTANVRNAIIRAIKDGVITREEYNKIISELSSDSRQWSSRNRKYFNISEEGIKLSKWGLRILTELNKDEEELVLSDDDLNEAFKFGKKGQYSIDDINDGYGFWGTLSTAGFKRRVIEDNWFSAMAWLTESYKFSDAGALYYLNAKAGRWIADQVIENQGRKDVVDILEDYATDAEWKKWSKEYNKYAQEEMMAESKEPFTFSEKEVKDAADLIAKAISKIDKVKAEVHDMDYADGKGAGFEISMDGEKYDGGSYDVRPNGDVVNVAIGNSFPNAVYTKIGDKNLNQIIKNIKKFESVVTEKFVKEFDKAVLDAETEKDVLKVYPDAEFYVGKSSHFFGQLEKNLFFKAYYAKYYQEDYGKKIKGDFKITTIYSEKGSRYVNLYVHESAIVEKDDAGTHLDNLESIVGKARDFFAIGKELDKGGYKKKYFYSDTMAPSYTIEIDGFKFAIINKKYVDKGDREVGDIAIGLLENMNTNIKNNLDMKNTLNIFESFSNFLDFNLLNESFKSMRFAELFMSTSTYSGDKKFNKELVKAFYNRTKINLQKVEDEDLLTIDPVTAYKNKTPNTIVFYISDNEKENPYAPYDTYSSNKRIPGGGYLLAMGTGKNEFLGVQWSRYSQERSLSRVDKGDSYSSVGISKKYKGWDATGLYNVKRIAEVADRAVVINVELLQQKYSTAELRSSRENARKGATAFKSDKAFKDENQARYREILNNKAAKLPLDKMVKDAIDVLAKQLSDGLSKGEMTKYNEIKIGTDPRGREVKAKDASSHMTSILDDYARYVDYIRQAEESEARYGDRESYYERESKAYAKRIKDKIKKIESYDYAW